MIDRNALEDIIHALAATDTEKELAHEVGRLAAQVVDIHSRNDDRYHGFMPCVCVTCESYRPVAQQENS